MISIDFEWDSDRALNDARRYSPRSPACGRLTTWLFSFPTDIVVDGVSVVAWNPRSRPKVPMVQLALEMERAVRALRADQPWTVDLVGVTRGSLTVEPTGEEVRLRNDVPETDLQVTLGEFVDAALSFSEHIRELLSTFLPAAAEDELIGPWVTGEAGPPPRIPV